MFLRQKSVTGKFISKLDEVCTWLPTRTELVDCNDYLINIIMLAYYLFVNIVYFFKYICNSSSELR